MRARVAGYLDRFTFEDGSEVKKGDLLFEIDPRPYKAVFDRAASTLAQAEAKAKRMEADFRRKSSLYARSAISREEYDLSADEYAESKGAIGVAEADRDSAELNLGFTKVFAPLTGRISRRMVDPGNIIHATDQTGVVTIVIAVTSGGAKVGPQQGTEPIRIAPRIGGVTVSGSF